MKTATTEFEFLINLLPNYFITHTSTDKSEQWRCRSNTGIRTDSAWEATVNKFADRWKERLKEIYHNTNTDHVDFVIYLKPQTND